MARIVGVDIPRNKKVPYSLSYIHGIGLTTAKLLCQEAKVDINARVQDLTEEQVVAIRNAIGNLELKVEGELRSQVAMNIKRLKDAGAYRALKMDKELKQMLEPVKVKNVLLGLVRAQQYKIKRVKIGR